MSRLFTKMAAGELAVSVAMKGGAHLVPTLAKAGFDCVRPDMMFSSIDWKELDHIITKAQACGITSCIRVQSNPWVGGENNLQVTVDAARAFSIGVDVVQVSVASAAQVKALLEGAKDWHRSGAGWYPSSSEGFTQHLESVSREAMVLPTIESLTGLRDIEEILALDGMRVIGIAVTDLAERLGYRLGYDHPDVWALIDKIVAAARSRGIIVSANTGYLYRTPEAIADRIAKLYDHGVRIVLIQTIEFLMEHLCGDVLHQVQRRIA